MLQKIIQVGNSYAVTIPKAFVDELQLQIGEKVRVDADVQSEILTMQRAETSVKRGDITPEFLSWLEKFNKKYKHVLTELAKK
ncbi:MAG TPA: AbrB/MazE/SpoVT family DNA-binding domain-containing protein [Candidatus Saccharimonadales bacterium]|nr:AbrB/MazE/SpoVT family DNA-binding domain-containing protein [Candidatus Saccharimonadales bacterium]